MKKVIKCPKCGSTNFEWHHGGRTEQRECLSCGYIGHFNEELEDDSGGDIWP